MKNLNILISDKHIAWAFFLFGGLPAMFFALDKNYVYFYQNFAPESIMWACGLGMLQPGEILEPLSKFTYGQLRELDCAIFDNLGSPAPASFFAKIQPYFTWSSAFLWRIFGLNYTAILPLVLFLYSIFSGGAYVLSRLFLERKFAIPAALLICLAPLTIGMSIYLRDFSKAPFFIWAIAFLVLSIRGESAKQAILFAIYSAAVMGIGYGFRIDIIILAPIAILVLLIGAGSNIPDFRKKIIAKLTATFFFIVTGAIVASPVWINLSINSAGGSAIIQGASEYFRISNGLKATSYTLGWNYSDEITLSGIAAEERPSRPKWDAQEPESLKGVSQALQVSTLNLVKWADVFAADFYGQALQSAGWILGFPALYERADIDVRFAKATTKGHYGGAKITLPFYQIIGQPWLPVLGGIGALVLLWRRFMHSATEALCLTLLFGFLITYPALQFAPRHVFHLEFVWVISMFSLAAVWFDKSVSVAQLKSFAFAFVVFASAIAFTYAGSIWWQTKTLSAEIANLTKLPRELVATSRSTLSDQTVFIKVPVPSRHKAMINAKPDSMTPSIRYRGVQWDVRASADRLLVQLQGDSCPVESRKFQIRYFHAPQVWQEFDSDHFLNTSNATGISTALIPAFYRPTQHFAGILLPVKFASCLVRIERINGKSRLPLVLTANLELGENGGKLAGALYKLPGYFGATIDKTTVTRKRIKPKEETEIAVNELKLLMKSR